MQRDFLRNFWVLYRQNYQQNLTSKGKPSVKLSFRKAKKAASVILTTFICGINVENKYANHIQVQCSTAIRR